jgi:predicted XRE-type DNA-binding protein
MYRKLAEITGLFAPKIKEAIERSNADLARQPQTPAIQEQVQRNAKIDPTSTGAGLTADKDAAARRDDLLKTRAEIERANQELVTQGAISQAEANQRIEKSYADIKPQVLALNEVLLQQLEIQKSLGKIAPETYDLMKAKIEETTAAATGLTKEQKKFQDAVSGVIANAAVNGLNSIAESIGKVIAGTESWGDALKDVGMAFAKFAADVLKGIAEIIIKEQILALIKLAFAAAHGGGIVGSTGMTRSGISPLVFLGAPRMHNGGLAGDEVATILKRGEEVLPMTDPRHRNNLMNGGSTEVTSGGTNIKNVLVMDPADLSKALAGAHGEKVVLTHLKNNPSTVRSIIGAT